MKYFLSLITLLFITTACSHQSDIAFYGYPAADSEYSNNEANLYDDTVIGEDFYIEQTNTANNVQYETASVSALPKDIKDVAEPVGITVNESPTQIIAEIDNADITNLEIALPAKPSYNIPKCSANATLAYDSKNIPTCFTQTADAGRSCSDSRQCSSYCVTSKDIVQTDVENIEGACFGLSPYTGCENVLQNGKIAEICS
jgi:hypothetical protein